MSLAICWSFRTGAGAGTGCWGAEAACCAAGVGWSSWTNGFLQPVPRTRKPVRTTNETLLRIGKSVFMGEILGSTLVADIPSSSAIELFAFEARLKADILYLWTKEKWNR